MFSVRCWMFNVPRRLLRRIPPDPITLVDVHRAVLFEANRSAVILPVPADRVETQLSIARAAKMQTDDDGPVIDEQRNIEALLYS